MSGVSPLSSINKFSIFQLLKKESKERRYKEITEINQPITNGRIEGLLKNWKPELPECQSIMGNLVVRYLNKILNWKQAFRIIKITSFYSFLKIVYLFSVCLSICVSVCLIFSYIL